MSDQELKSYAIDFYSGMIPNVKGLKPDIPSVKPKAVVQPTYVRDLPADMNYIVGWIGYISSFPLLHVDSWLSFDLIQPGNKQGPGIWGKFGCGNTGGIATGQFFPPPYHKLVPQARKIYGRIWAHNMNKVPYDFHVGYVFHYI